MADCVTQRPGKSRFAGRGLVVCGWLAASTIIYVVSIGPLVWLEGLRFGSDQTWQTLRATFYQPVYLSWWHGPRFWVDFLDRYTRYFEADGAAPQLGPDSQVIARNYYRSQRFQEKRRQERLSWEKEHPNHSTKAVAAWFLRPMSEEESAEGW